MAIRRWWTAALAAGLASVAGVAAYRTQDKWVLHVFPAKTEAKSDHDHGEGHEGHDHGARDDRVTLSPQAQKNLGLDVDTLEPRAYWRTILIPGIVVDRPGESDRAVPTRVAGVIAELLAKPGDTVRAGEPLAVLHLVSEYLQGTQTDLVKSTKELEFATARRDRIAEAVKKGTQSGTVLIEEENQVKRFTTQVQAYRRQLSLFGLSTEQVDRAEKGEIITQLTVTAPGTKDQLYEVQELKVNLGDSVQAGQSLVTLANHQKLFVEGRAFKSEADALAIAAEKQVPIRAEFADEKPGAWPAQEPLVIHHLSNQVNPATRTFAVYLALENQPRTFARGGKSHYVWRYRPGQQVRLKMPVEKLVTVAADGTTERLPFVLPAGAVVREGPEAFVFVQSGDVFIRKPVRILYADRTDAVIANDGSVSEVEFVVKNQAAAINRAVKAQSAGGGGHGHDHDHDH